MAATLLTARRVLLVLCVAGGLIAGCTRPRENGADGFPFVTPSPETGAASSTIQIEQPEPGAEIGSPVEVSGVAQTASGQTLAAQVHSRTDDGRLRWRGNGPLAVEDDGRYRGEIRYTLPPPEDGQSAPVPGVVEVMIIDPVSGTVLERSRVDVTLRYQE